MPEEKTSSNRLELAIAILIAIVSLTTAVAAWRTNVVGSKAGDAARLGLIAAHASGQGWLTTVSGAVREHLELGLLLYQQMGPSQEQLDFLENSLAVIQRVLVAIIPAMVVGSTLMTTWVSVLVAAAVVPAPGLAVSGLRAVGSLEGPGALRVGRDRFGRFAFGAECRRQDAGPERVDRVHGD